MESRTEQHDCDLQDTAQYGQYLNEPSNQLVRLISLFRSDQRVQLLKDAHSQSLGVYSGPSWKQFIAFQVLNLFVHEMRPHDLGWISVGGEIYSQAKWKAMMDVVARGSLPRRTLSLAKLCPEVQPQVATTLSGEDSRGVARILANTLLAEDLTRNDELVRLIGRTVQDSVLTAEQAAALASAVEYNNQDVARFEAEAEYLVDETPLIPGECFESNAQRLELTHHADLLSSILDAGRMYREASLQQQHELAAIDELCESYRLAPGPTGLFVPLRQHLLVARSIAEAEQLARDSRGLLLAMSPREFEEFMANVFKDLGFDVELTKTTRDGGVDLICMRSLHGIPIRIAVELKRYRNRPIDVNLVRSFVGANEQWQANRLLYVTTSRYTASAHEFADRFAKHILTLKEYDQIAEWCSVAGCRCFSPWQVAFPGDRLVGGRRRRDRQPVHRRYPW